MSSTADAAREWMDEGDHLLARAYEFLAGAATDPVQAALAADYFSKAAQTYLGGAVAQQSGGASVASPLPDAQELMTRLTGRLRAEAIAADRSSSARVVPAGSRPQALAEALRERFTRVIPEEFGQLSNGMVERLPSEARSR